MTWREMESKGERGSSELEMKQFKVQSFPTFYRRVVKEQLNIIVSSVHCDSDAFISAKGKCTALNLFMQCFYNS